MDTSFITYTRLEELLTELGLSAEVVPSLENWQAVLQFMEQREYLVEVLRQTSIDIPDALVFIFDEALRIIAVNKPAVQALGFSSQGELIGRDARAFINEKDLPDSIARFGAIMSGDDVPVYERVLHPPNQASITTLVSLELLENPASGKKFIKSIMRDVTHLREAQAEVQRQQDYLQEVVRNAPIVLWACEPDGTLTYQHQLSKATENPSPLSDNILRVYAYDADIVQSIQLALRGEEQHLSIEAQSNIFDARLRPVLENGKVIRVIGVLTDITELISTQTILSAIQESTARTRDHLEAIVNNSNDGIIVTTLDGHIAQTNPAFDQLLGLQRDEAFAMPIAQYIQQNGREMFQQAVSYALSSKQAVRLEVEVVTQYVDSELVADILCSPILSSESEVTGLVFSMRDITAYSELLVSLAESRDEALELSELKSEFLAMMSHEIRTPLHAIMGLNEIIAETALDDEQREMVDIIQDQSDYLLEMLNTILDYSKIEADKLILEDYPFVLQDAVIATALGFKGQADSKQITLAIDSQIPMMLIVEGDQNRLRQVLSVFINNAIKFTEEGTVTVSARVIEQTKNDISVRFAITDTGMGIAKNKIANLFEPFVQADTSHTRQYGGTGLGLAIAHGILELMGSRIDVESVVGEGTTFSFTVRYPLILSDDAL